MDYLFQKPEYPAERLPAPAGVEAAFCQCEGDRDEQQDACGLFLAGGGMLAVVADGMGALARGGSAAAVAVEATGEEAARLLAAGASYGAVKESLTRVNSQVYLMVDNMGVMGMSGTTLCAAAVLGNGARLFWSGDSRAYLWRCGVLTRLTEDHVYARYLAEMVAEGVITEAEARANPQRTHLTGYLGMRALEDYSVMASTVPIQRGDSLLLCTDGLYKCLDEEEMGHCLSRGAYSAAGSLIGLVAKKRLRYQDNATALVLRWTK